MAKGIKKYDATKFLHDPKQGKIPEDDFFGSVGNITDNDIVNHEAIAPNEDDINEELGLMGTFLND